MPATLAAKVDVALVAKLEQMQVTMCGNQCAMAPSDAKHSLFLPTNWYGSGYKSTMVCEALCPLPLWLCASVP